MSQPSASKPAALIAGSVLCVLTACGPGMDASTMGSDGLVQGGVDASGQEPGRADDFSWEWNEVTAVPDAELSYLIPVRFTNISSDPSRIPNCWAVPGPGRADILNWEQDAILGSGEKATVQGIVSFERPIPEIDEVVCDPKIAEGYRN